MIYTIDFSNPKSKKMSIFSTSLPVVLLNMVFILQTCCLAQHLGQPELEKGHLESSNNEKFHNPLFLNNNTVSELLNQSKIIDRPTENEQNSTVDLIESLVNQTVSLKEHNTKPKLNCTPVFRDDSNMTSHLVLVNVTTIARYLQLKIGPSLDIGSSSATPSTTNQSIYSPGQCTVLIFYLDWCPFSAAAAVHFNALGRLFPQMNILAIDAYSLYSTTMRYGVVGVPSFYIFHNSKIVSKYNKSDVNIDSYVRYITSITALEPIGQVNITESDRIGPLSSQVSYTFNYVFVGSWAFCILVSFYYFTRSDIFRRIKEHIYNMWNEAQFQHEHID